MYSISGSPNSPPRTTTPKTPSWTKPSARASAPRCELFAWRTTPEGRLAEVLVLDQFSRNVYRDTARAFAQDALAFLLAQELVASGQDRSLPLVQRSFAYMPYMHSESALVHAQAALLFAQPGMEDTFRFELRHKEIIDRFGLYPHRNALLGRESSPEELDFFERAGVEVLASLFVSRVFWIGSNGQSL